MPAPEKATEIKAAIAAVLAFFTALWGWLGWAVLVWIFCFLLDYLSGTAAARKAGEWSSSIAREGVWHKLGEIFAVLVAALCDIALNPNASFVLFVGLGCENNGMDGIKEYLAPYGRDNIAYFNCQDVEDEHAYGMAILEKFSFALDDNR